jgi:hypothetical protein
MKLFTRPERRVMPRGPRFRMTAALASAAFVLAGAVAASAAPASADGAADSALAAMAATYLAAHPGGTLVGDTVQYPDGTLFVAVADGVDSLSQCPASSFCMWSSANFAGSVVSVSGQAVRFPLTNTVLSAWNNRPYTAKLFNSDATTSTCFAVGEQRASIATAYQHPQRVRLTAMTASC